MEVDADARARVAIGTADGRELARVWRMLEGVPHVSRVLEREAFRVVCGRYRTREAIVAALA